MLLKNAPMKPILKKDFIPNNLAHTFIGRFFKDFTFPAS